VGVLIAPVPAVLFGGWGPGVSILYYGRLLDRPPQILAITILSLTFILFWYFLSLKIRNIYLANMTIGALVPLWIGMGGTSIVLPALSFMFTWPLLFSLLACANWFYWNAKRKNAKPVLVGLLLSGIATIIILGPTILLGLFDLMSVTLILVGVLCGFLVPQIHVMLGSGVENQE
jgi:hypothetical protein